MRHQMGRLVSHWWAMSAVFLIRRLIRSVRVEWAGWTDLAPRKASTGAGGIEVRNRGRMAEGMGLEILYLKTLPEGLVLSLTRLLDGPGEILWAVKDVFRLGHHWCLTC